MSSIENDIELEANGEKPTDDLQSASESVSNVSYPSHQTLTDTETEQEKSKTKVDVLLKAAGNAPIMKRKKWSVEKVKHIGSVVEFVKKYLKCDPSESLFLYVNQSFSPSPDTEIGTLYNCFGSDGKLVLHYCKIQAWG